MKTKIKVSVIIISSFILFLFGGLFINTAEKASNFKADIYRSTNVKKGLPIGKSFLHICQRISIFFTKPY